MKTNAASALYGTNIAGLAGTGQGNARTNENATASFTDALNSSAGKSDEMNCNNKASQSTTVTGNKSVKEMTDNQLPEKKSLDENEKISATKEIAEDVKKIISEIKEKFDVTDDDIEKAMETLGITVADLFTQEDLKNLLMTVTNTEDSVMLLTDVDLYGGMNDITDMMNNLKNEVISEYGIDDEAFSKIIDEGNELFEGTIETDKLDLNAFEKKAVVDKDNLLEEQIVQNFDDSKEIIPDIEDKEDVYNVRAFENDNQIKTVNVSEPQEENDKVKVQVNVDKTETVVSDEAIKKIVTDTEKNGKENAGEDSHQEPHSELFTSFSEMTGNTVADVVESVESYSNAANTENIMRQVTEFVKVNITANSTSMELELHPASLGTVNMQVVSQNGQVTAQFTVQNEAVKAVLESQLLTLQESLNEAGTKVSAIEVTVANYNLDKGTEGNTPENNKDNGQKGSKRRNIDLSSLDSFDDFDDEEMMEAKVMEMNGNTVSYTV